MPQISSSFLPGLVADFNIVNHLDGSRSLRHPRGRTFVLYHPGRALPERNAVLDVHRKSVLANLRLCQLGPDDPLDFAIAQSRARHRSGWRCSSASGIRARREQGPESERGDI